LIMCKHCEHVWKDVYRCVKPCETDDRTNH
jgi:hypothetical protein